MKFENVRNFINDNRNAIVKIGAGLLGSIVGMIAYDLGHRMGIIDICETARQEDDGYIILGYENDVLGEKANIIVIDSMSENLNVDFIDENDEGDN